MSLIQLILSDNAIISMPRIIRLEARSSCILAARRRDRVALTICKPAVGHESRRDETADVFWLMPLLIVIKILMEATNGLGVILENRYYGESYPYSVSTTDNLRFLTAEQSNFMFDPLEIW